LIRQIAIGETGNITVWRDGNQQQLKVTMQPGRQVESDSSHQAGFGRPESADSDLAARTLLLERQVDSLRQELATLRQELTQFRTNGPVQTGFNAEAKPGAAPLAPQSRYTPGFGAQEEKPLKPTAEATKPAPPAPTPTEKSSSNDLFDSAPAPQKSQEKQKPEEKPKADDKGGSDDLFK